MPVAKRKRRTDASTLVPEDVKRRVYAEMEVSKAFREMIHDIRGHNADYHQHTTEAQLQAWEKRLEDWETTRS